MHFRHGEPCGMFALSHFLHIMRLSEAALTSSGSCLLFCVFPSIAHVPWEMVLSFLLITRSYAKSFSNIIQFLTLEAIEETFAYLPFKVDKY